MCSVTRITLVIFFSSALLTTGCGGKNNDASGVHGSLLYLVSQAVIAPQTDTTASCEAGDTLIGGGAKCGADGNVTQMLKSLDDFVVTCNLLQAGENPAGHAICARGTRSISWVTFGVSSADTPVQASCINGQKAVSADLTCGTEATFSTNALYPVDEDTWEGECDGLGTSARIQVYCIDPTATFFGGKSLAVKQAAMSGTSDSIQCDSGKTLISGGCACPNDSAMDNSYTSDLVSWNCHCNAGAGTAYALCM